MKKIFFDKSLTFFLPLIGVTFLFLFINYNFSINNYTQLETKQNSKNIKNFIYILKNNYTNSLIIEKSDYENIKKICSKFFEECKNDIQNNQSSENKSIVNLENETCNNIEIFTYNKDSQLINEFKFSNTKNELLFQIKTRTKLSLLAQGKEDIKIYSSIVLIFLILTLLIGYIYKSKIKIVNENLEGKVEKRTNQIHHTMKELEKVNLKLYDLAHTDYLTQIKNRRSFLFTYQ